MCGICGIINFDKSPVSREELRTMNNSLSHRGPDDYDIYINKNYGLAHRRLSIIDLNTGKQPLCNEDETIWITFNGEIYNFKKLKNYLSKRGHIFKTNTDTEVIVHLYETFGKDSVAMLEGMFAYTILDLNKNKVYTYRDRLGQKPLFYTFQNHQFLFASELQAIANSPAVNKEIDYQQLHDYLTLLYVPAPYTIYKGIKKLMPGSFLEIDIKSANHKVTKYWNSKFNRKTNISYEDAKSKLRNLTKKAVEKRLMSDVPLGAFLSGGVDSSIVCGLMSEITDAPINTFTIGFNDTLYDERVFADEASKKFKTNHHEKIVNPADFSIVESLVKNYGEPYADSSMLPTYLLSKFTREHVTVALSGDGADEFFTGYYRYLAFKHSLKLDFLPKAFRKNFRNFSDKVLPPQTSERNLSGKLHRLIDMTSTERNKRYLKIIDRTSEKEKALILGNSNFITTQHYFDSIADNLTSSDPIEQLMETDINSYLPNDILTKVDIASMANSLEVRSPFLDHKLIEFINSLPLKYKLFGNTRKRILVDAFSDLLPQTTAKRAKMGFGVPVASWIRNEWKELTKELLLDGNGIQSCGFSKNELEKLINNHIQSKSDNSYIIWCLIIFEIWYNHFMN